jgi:predicted DNA-binding WGR domain protein
MTLAHLQRPDPDRNMARFYQVDLVPTLFGEACVLRSWGRVGTRGRTVFETCPNLQAAEASGRQTIRAKLKRGYSAA